MVVPNEFHPYTNQTIFAYSPREKLVLSKFDRNEKQGVYWFNETK
jgi:hypothetical protein